MTLSGSAASFYGSAGATVQSGGSAVGTLVQIYGVLRVFNGGRASDTVINGLGSGFVQAGATLSAFIARFKRRRAIAAQLSDDYTSSRGFLQRRARS